MELQEENELLKKLCIFLCQTWDAVEDWYMDGLQVPALNESHHYTNRYPRLQRTYNHSTLKRISKHFPHPDLTMGKIRDLFPEIFTPTP